MTRTLALMLAGALATLTTGCTQIPTRELSQYRSAFAEVQSGSEAVLIDFAEAIEVAQKRQAEEAPPPDGPTPFSATLPEIPVREADAIDVRREALRTVDKFNNVLVTLAEGKSLESVKGTADGFVQAASQLLSTAAGGAVPGLSALSAPVQTLLGEFEKARLREEFVKAVRDGAPVADRILAVLAADRESHYALRADEANQRQLEIVDQMRAAAVAVRDVIEAHGPPSGTADPLPDLQKALAGSLEPLGRSPALAFTRGKPPFDASAKALAEEGIARIAGQAKAFRANAAQIQGLVQTLNAYGAMLERARLALAALVAALDKPARFEETAERLRDIAFQLKRDFEVYRAARAAAR